MGTVIKYIIYVLIIIALYIVGKGLYTGSITNSTTIGDVAVQIDNGTREIARDTANAVNEAVDDVKQTRQHQ